MLNPNPLPKDYGLPYTTFRPGQLESIQLTENALQNATKNGQVARTVKVAIEMPTGGGKSGVAGGLAHVMENLPDELPSLYLAQNLGLVQQMADNQGFAPLFGRAEYPCVHTEKIARWATRYGTNRIPTAADCHYDRMTECPVVGMCPYYQARSIALTSKRMACTYQYAGYSAKIKARNGFIALDEVQFLPSEMMRFATVEVSESTRKYLDLPPFPFQNGFGEGYLGAVVELEKDRAVLTKWLTECVDLLDDENFEPLDERASRAKNLRGKLGWILESMRSVEWFLRSGALGVEINGKKTAGFEARALSASLVAPDLWMHKSLALYMTATFGDPVPLMKSVGIGEKEFEFHTFPHPVPVSARKVDVIFRERVTKYNLDRDDQMLKRQARRIASWIDELPQHYRGMILTSSRYKIGELYKLLPDLLENPNRLWTPNRTNPSGWIEDFTKNKAQGLIGIGTIQGLGHGVDLNWESGRFVVIAGVPHENPSDPFYKAYIHRHGRKLHDSMTYLAIPQAGGRVTRGEHWNDFADYKKKNPQTLLTADDFGEGGYLTSHVAIADESAVTPTAQRYFPKYFLEAIV